MRISDWSSDVCSSDLCSIAPNDPRATVTGATSAAVQSVTNSSSSAPSQRPASRSRAVIASLAIAPSKSIVAASRLSPVSIAEGFIPGAARYTNPRSEEHTSELQSLMRISYAVFCLKKTNVPNEAQNTPQQSEATTNAHQTLIPI